METPPTLQTPLTQFDGELMLRWLLLLGLLLWTAPVHAATFFDTDFEAGATACDWTANNWIDFGQAPCGGKMSMSTDTAISGTHALKLIYETYNNTFCVTPCRSIYKGSSAVPPFPAGDHRFFRWAVKVTSGFQISSYNTKEIIFHNGSYPRPIASLNSGNYVIQIEGAFDNTGLTEQHSTGVAPSRDQWDQVEMEFLMNTCGQANGLVRMWVNGVLRVEVLNRAWRGNGTTAGGLAASCATQVDLMQFYLQNGVGTIYYDRVAAGDTRIGLVNGSAPPPPAGDTTPPSPPTSVTVN